MSESAKWYVVHTYSGYENKVAATIQKTVENRHLEDLIFDIRVPMENVTELRDNGEKKEVERKMFPGYVLIKMVMNDDSWYVVRNTRGVTSFVGPGSKPVALTEHSVRKIVSRRVGSLCTSLWLAIVAVVVPVAWVILICISCGLRSVAASAFVMCFGTTMSATL